METNGDDVSVLALGVRGYSCQVFADPQTAWKLHQETHLIAWHGESDGDLRVDRFDARNLLEDRNLFRQLKKRKRKAPEKEEEGAKVAVQGAGEEEAAETEQQLLHRLRFGDYAVEFPPKEEETFASENKFPYQYMDDESDPESDGEAFELQWEVPAHLKVPKTKKRHAILEATANKVRGLPQLEVMLKVKLGENKKFRFLDASHALHEYYCFLRDENPQPSSVKKPAVRVSLLGDEYASDSDEEESKPVEEDTTHDQNGSEERKSKVARHHH